MRRTAVADPADPQSRTPTLPIRSSGRPESMADSKPMDDAAYGRMQKAMCYRVKYRVNAEKPKRRFPIPSMGVHMMNRGGHEVYPNGGDVRELGVQLDTSTFDLAEANHNDIAVEEAPAEVRMQVGFKDPVTRET